jgi:hypothetical protein
MFAARIHDLKMLYQYADYGTETLIDYLVDDYGCEQTELANRTTQEVWGEIEIRQSEYGLAFDYVPAGTFDDQRHGYFRYQLSYGGPSEEFRFFVDLERQLVKAEFWLLDWFTGQSVDCSNDETIKAIWSSFKSAINHDL